MNTKPVTITFYISDTCSKEMLLQALIDLIIEEVPREKTNIDIVHGIQTVE